MSTSHSACVSQLTAVACGLSSHVEYYVATRSPLEFVKDGLFLYFAVRYARKGFVYLYGHGFVATGRNLYEYFARKVFNFITSLGPVKKKIDAQVQVVLDKLETDMVKRDQLTFHKQLPATGWSTEQVIAELDFDADLDAADWQNGRVSGAIYHGGKDLNELQTVAYGKFSMANQLHPDVFPGIRKMESEIVEMVLALYNAPETACGTSTSGGTESLLLTCLAAREKARIERGVTEPEILAPITIHAGFDKAAFYFGMKLVHVPLGKDFKVDIKAMKRLINHNTVIIAGSAPNFPHGIIDDIEAMSELAVRYKIPLHVDCCLGSLVVPFLEENGFNPPVFDFRLPGVTSISCDTHKYGFAPKGSSIIMYRNEELRHYQYFIETSWSGGLYASPTLAGSRPGALMAGCWATLMHIGHSGYKQLSYDIVSTAQEIKHSINEIDCLYVLGDPIGSVVSFASDKINIYDLSDGMSKKGWHLNALQNPPAVHIACTRLTIGHVKEFITDLKQIADELLLKNTGKPSSDVAVLYGVAGSVQTAGVADRIAAGFLDNLYKV